MTGSNVTSGDDQRIAALIGAANKALAEGRADEAARLVQQAELESPQHPLVLNEIGQRMLRSGDMVRAHELFVEAVKGAASNPSLWINLAAALRGLNRHDEEMQALDRVLAIEPANLRAMLQKASIYELQNNTRAAAFTYRKALQSITPMTRVPQWMHEVLMHARKVVEGNNRALESFLEERLSTLRAEYAQVPLRRFDRCMAILMQRQLIYRQQPTFLYFPELPPIEFHERANFPWLDSIEAATDDIRAELVDVLAEDRAALEPTLRTGRPARSNRNGASCISPAAGASTTYGAKALPIRSILRDVPGLRPRSKAGLAAKFPARVPAQCSRFSTPRPGFRLIPASTTRASSCICR